MLKTLKLFALVISLAMVSCQNNPKESNLILPKDGNQKAIVKEVIQTSAYTYLRLDNNNEEVWIAITKRDITEGSTVYYKEGLKMENFTSPELQRTFEAVYFVQEISDQPIKAKMLEEVVGSEPKKPVLSKLEIKIEQPAGGTSIGELYAKRNEYAGKKVIVKGQVTKVNIAIMERNWIHLQDGTSEGKDFDLTITTIQEPKVGDVVTYTGTLVLNKDFGSGYTYELLLEDASPLELY